MKFEHLYEAVNKKSEDGRWVDFYYFNDKGEKHRLDGPAECRHVRFGSYGLVWYINDNHCGLSMSGSIDRPELTQVPSEFFTTMVSENYSSKQIVDTAVKLREIGYILPVNVRTFMKQSKYYRETYGED